MTPQQLLARTILAVLSITGCIHAFSPIRVSNNLHHIDSRVQSIQYRSTQRMELGMALIQNFDAILFDCDGVIAETERDAHRVTFNEAFKEAGLSTNWDVELYGELLRVGGGKERMTAHFETVGWPSDAIVKEEDRVEFIKNLHKSKTAKFQKTIESGVVPARPGVLRLIDEAFTSGLQVAICSTSNVDAVTTIARVLLGEERLAKINIYAGDMVENKKPAPDVYLLAAKELSLDPSRCWVVEDSEIGMQAALSAGMKCVVTKSIYTKNEDFSRANLVVEDLNSGLDGPISTTYLDYKASSKAFKPVKPSENADMFAAKDRTAEMFSKIAKGDMGRGFPM